MSVLATPGATPAQRTAEPAITFYIIATPTARATEIASAPTDVPTPAPSPSPVPTPRLYVVEDGDTPWDIALKFRMSVDDLLAANPGVNPSLLRPGASLTIPGPGAPPVTVSRPITLDAIVSNLVNVDGINLALRKGPGTTQDLMARLPAFSPLKILGRTEDSAWLKVATVEGQEGLSLIYI